MAVFGALRNCALAGDSACPLSSLGLSGVYLVRWGAVHVHVRKSRGALLGRYVLGVHPLAGPAWLGGLLAGCAGNPIEARFGSVNATGVPDDACGGGSDGGQDGALA